METEPEMRTAHAAVLGKADPAVGRELGRLDLGDCGTNDVAKFQASDSNGVWQIMLPSRDKHGDNPLRFRASSPRVLYRPCA